MKIFLYVSAALGVVFALMCFSESRTILDQISGLILFVMSAICLVGAVITQAIERLHKDLVQAKDQPSSGPLHIAASDR